MSDVEHKDGFDAERFWILERKLDLLVDMVVEVLVQFSNNVDYEDYYERVLEDRYPDLDLTEGPQSPPDEVSEKLAGDVLGPVSPDALREMPPFSNMDMLVRIAHIVDKKEAKVRMRNQAMKVRNRQITQLLFVGIFLSLVINLLANFIFAYFVRLPH